MSDDLFSPVRRKLAVKNFWRVLGIALVVLPLSTSIGAAQSSGGISSILNQLDPNSAAQILQGHQQNSVQVVPPTVPTGSAPPSSNGVQQAPLLTDQAPSRLETIMSDRSGSTLRMFGYSQLGYAQTAAPTQAGAVQDNYILGPGDQLAISLRGQQQADYQVSVDRDGRVILPNMPPIPAGGRRFGDFRADLDAAVHRAFISTTDYVSVAQVRQVSVVVAGNVYQPGVKVLTGLSTPLDAVLMAGGVSKTGSLRGIKVIRGSRTLPYDLYGILTHQGAASNLTLADGDKIIVPPLGQTVAVTGWVRQPAIYEVAPGTIGMSSRSLIRLAGGVEVRGRYHLVLLRINSNGIREFVTVNDGTLVRDGDILFVQPANDEQVGGATLSGGASLAGKYSVGKSGSLAEMLRPAGAMGANPDTLFGVISRRDARDYQRTLIAFSPLSILGGGTDVALQTGDIVRVFQVDEMHMLVSAVGVYGSQVKLEAQQAYSLNPANPMEQLVQQQQGIPVQGTAQSPLDMLTNGNAAGAPLANAGMSAPNQPIGMPGSSFPGNNPPGSSNSGSGGAAANGAAANGGSTVNNAINNLPGSGLGASGIPQFSDIVGDLDVTPQAFVNFLIDHQIRVGGAVGDPGIYFVGQSVSLNDVLKAAGGATRWANLSNIEIVSAHVNNLSGTSETTRENVGGDPAQLASILIKPRDEVQIQQVYTQLDAGVVNVQGEVVSPGKYPITHGEHLSQLLIQVGGLSNYAYPYGTVFLRQSVAANEARTYQRTADEMEKQMVTGLSRGSASATGSLSPDAFTGLQKFVDELRTRPAVGRMTVTADPSVLASHPDTDPLLEDGDVIFIPQRPSTVSVMGEVMQPGTFQFEAKMSAKEYIERAGGFGSDAEEDEAFVVYPDGTAQRITSSWLGNDTGIIPPGSIIYVPRNLFPLDWLSLSTTLADILKDFAISAASLAVLHQK